MTFNFEDQGKQHVVENLREMAKANDNFRTTVWSGTNLQVTLMTIPAHTDMGLEAHHNIDQMYLIVEGEALCQMGETKENLDFEKVVIPGENIMVPANMWHNITNNGDVDVKMVTFYGAIDHVPGTVHKTKEDAMNDPNEQDEH